MIQCLEQRTDCWMHVWCCHHLPACTLSVCIYCMKKKSCEVGLELKILRSLDTNSLQDVTFLPTSASKHTHRHSVHGVKGTVHTKCRFSQWSVVVHRTVLELHSQTELQRSAEQLKHLRLDLNIRSLHQLVCCDHSHTTWSQTRFTPLLTWSLNWS